MTDGELLLKENIDKIRHIPCIVNQGRYDMVCPAKTAYDLFKQWPEIEFNLIPDCGHAAKDPGMLHSECGTSFEQGYKSLANLSPLLFVLADLIQSTDKMKSV